MLVLGASAPACSPATTPASEAAGSDASAGADATADAAGGDDTGLGAGDAALGCPGGLGCPCESPNDCNIAYCLETQDGGRCTVNDACDGKGGCVAGKATCGRTKDEQCALVDDGDLCNGAYLCVNSKCIYDPKPKVCSDGNACTTDACDAKAGCGFAANTDPCDADGSACTVNDACKGGSGVSGDAKSCDDGEPCTSDSCDKSSGTCQHGNQTKPVAVLALL